ncbi:MAG: NYN domain-containing protein [Alphaproteobacteria bacterium]|nr:NYN domain-containing protein [Alphaproteobacteria bacterium SS10]MBV6634241.1 NYN domain-containing protein [Alphaproteobacteria bacterium SS10]
MIIYKQERLAMFIDGANLYHAAKNLDFDIDYKSLLRWATQRGRLIRAYYYTAIDEDQEYSPLKPLVDWLDYNGYTMVTKRPKEFTDSAGRRKTRGNMDVELAVDVMELAPHLDHVMLFSGDGDFAPLVDAIQRKGLRVTVISTTRTNPPMVADELRRKADNFFDLSDLVEEFARADRDEPRRPRRRQDEDDDYDDEDDY